MNDNNQYRYSSFLFFTLLSLVALLSFLIFTKPADDNFGFSLIPLMLLWLVVFFASGALLKFLISKKLIRTYAVISTSIAFTAVFLVMFSALGQFQIFDALLLIALMIMGVFYFSRTWRK